MKTNLIPFTAIAGSLVFSAVFLAAVAGVLVFAAMFLAAPTSPAQAVGAPPATTPRALKTPEPVEPPEPPSAPAGITQRLEAVVKDAARIGSDGARGAMKTVQAAIADATDSSAAFQFGAGAKASSRSLAVLTSGTDPQKTDEIEEDLSVMARILQKSARNVKEDDRLSAMGIYLDPVVFGSASGARNLYVEGHGAIFLLTVGYPLVGPCEDREPDVAEAHTNSEWDIARDEVLGRGRGSELALSGRAPSKNEAFDEQKIEVLKTSLLDALKNNAGHIRALRPDEFVTVVVQGADATEGIVRLHTSSNNGGGATAGSSPGNRGETRVRKEVRLNAKPGFKGESVMNIRVAKADIDAYTAGKLTDDAFRKKAILSTYLRRSEPMAKARR